MSPVLAAPVPTPYIRTVHTSFTESNAQRSKSASGNRSRTPSPPTPSRAGSPAQSHLETPTVGATSFRPAGHSINSHNQVMYTHHLRGSSSDFSDATASIIIANKSARSRSPSPQSQPSSTTSMYTSNVYYRPNTTNTTNTTNPTHTRKRSSSIRGPSPPRPSTPVSPPAGSGMFTIPNPQPQYVFGPTAKHANPYSYTYRGRFDPFADDADTDAVHAMAESELEGSMFAFAHEVMEGTENANSNSDMGLRTIHIPPAQPSEIEKHFNAGPPSARNLRLSAKASPFVPSSSTPYSLRPRTPLPPLTHPAAAIPSDVINPFADPLNPLPRMLLPSRERPSKVVRHGPIGPPPRSPRPASPSLNVPLAHPSPSPLTPVPSLALPPTPTIPLAALPCSSSPSSTTPKSWSGIVANILLSRSMHQTIGGIGRPRSCFSASSQVPRKSCLSRVVAE